jgi:peptide/nickel transport system ATP-binding protein
MLLSAVLEPGVPPPAEPDAARGEPPRPDAPPGGCGFHTRCPHVMERCRTEPPPLKDIGDAAPHPVRCWLV